eukprot:COSAG06_NODE_1399_length_9580_cov_24.435292_7_plen_31_part_00
MVLTFFVRSTSSDTRKALLPAAAAAAFSCS